MRSREEVRLRELFQRLLLVTVASSSGAGAVIACSTASSSTSSGDAGEGNDASVGGHDATTPTPDAGGDAGTMNDAAAADSAVDASPSCTPGPIFGYDAGDAASGCAYAAVYPCGLPSFVTMLYPPACYFALRDCAQLCTGVAMNPTDCRVAEGHGCDSTGAFVAPDGGPIVIECAKCSGVGRRPGGLARARFERATTALGDFFARVAHLEAASVDAFVALGDELGERGAPRDLVRMAARCARDERRHARVTSRLARRFGGTAPAPHVVRMRQRSETAMAIENAIEGCVRETFGAMVATWQAAHAGDAEIAEVMARIAIDETRHAAMAWDVARWLELRLDARARARIAAAKRAAIAELRREVASTPDASIVREAGVPDGAQATCLLDALDAALWAEPAPEATTRQRASAVTS